MVVVVSFTLNCIQIRTILLLEERNDVDYTRLGILAFSLLLQETVYLKQEN